MLASEPGPRTNINIPSQVIRTVHEKPRIDINPKFRYSSSDILQLLGVSSGKHTFNTGRFPILIRSLSSCVASPWSSMTDVDNVIFVGLEVPYLF